MEDGMKDNPAQHKEPKFLGKAGWVKKAAGRLLASYKDRYVHVEKTEVVVYEHEDLQTCLERLDLENYDKCHELKSPFKKKHRLVLIRSPKSGNKVHDMKFQAQSAEEKEAWIRALSDAIGRAKNKVFDEVTVDEGCNLEHVTRTRPKGNRNRRPPTRIHMKEVADVSCDGILRLDLDLEDAIMPNGTHHTTIDGAEMRREAPMPQSSPEEKEAQSELEVSPPKKVIKPPMPPFKEATPPVAVKDGADQVESAEKKVLKPPMPPSKEAKPCTRLPAEEATESQTSPDARKKMAPPPTPPNKPSSFNLADASHPHPPRPQSKDRKPPYTVMHVDAGDGKEEEDDGRRKATEDEEEALPQVRDDEPERPGAEWRVSEDQSEETVSHGVEAEPLRLVQPDMLHVEESSAETLPGEGLDSDGSETASSSQTENVSSVVVTLNDPLADGLGLSSLLGHLSGEIKEMAVEEKSVDSGQHSDNDSEGSESEAMLAASTAALRGSHAVLDALDTTEDGIQISVHLSPPLVTAKPQVRPKRPSPPLKLSTKVRSASIGDLLSDSAIPVQVRMPRSSAAPSDYVTKLETEVALEMEKTNELLSRVPQSQKDDDGEGVPEDLLAKAMEKLKKAEHVLKEIRKLKPANGSSHRKSW